MGTDCSDTRYVVDLRLAHTHACVSWLFRNITVGVGLGGDDISGGLLRFKNLAIIDS